MKSCFVAVILLSLPALAQKQRFTINATTPEGQMLQVIGEEPDAAKKLVLMEGFLAKYPAHEGVSWVCGQLETAYLGQKDYARALDAAVKGFAVDPEDLEIAYSGLKAAEGKEDPEGIKIWASRSIQIARKTTQSGKAPADDDEKAALERAGGVATYSEYSLYSQAVKAKDPKVTADFGEALEKANPKSTYMWQAAPFYLRALGAVKGCAAADRLAAADSKDAEALLFSADCNWRANHPDRMVTLASRALEALNTRQKVEGMNDTGKSTIANFYIGVGNGMQQRYGLCEKALRIALPAVKGDAITGPYATYYLGVSLYFLGKPLGDKSKMREGLQFLEQSAAQKSAVQDLATQSARTIRQELGIR